MTFLLFNRTLVLSNFLLKKLKIRVTSYVIVSTIIFLIIKKSTIIFFMK